MESALDSAHRKYIARKEHERNERMIKLREEMTIKVHQPIVRQVSEIANVSQQSGTELFQQANSKGIHRKRLRRNYKNLVWRLTENQDLSGVPNIHLRKWRNYDLDHIISIWDGFNLAIPAETIADVSNLRIIPHKENGLKGGKSDFASHPNGYYLGLGKQS